MRAPAATIRGIPRLAIRAPRIALRLPPHRRRRLLALLLGAVAIGAVYLGWLRNSSVVRVDKVAVTGLDTPDGARIRTELGAAGRRMTTLNVNVDALRAAVRHEPIVRSLSVSADFPHGLRIHVVENRPVALLTAAGRGLAVAPDGTLLPGARSAWSLPRIRLRALPAGGRLAYPSVQTLVTVAGAAPAPLLPRIDSLGREPGHGLVVRLRNGPAIWFGLPVDIAAKWRAATVVLAQRSSRGAAYVDVRMPERPVAGGLIVTGDPQPLAQQGPGGAPGAVPTAPGPVATPPGIPAQSPQQAAAPGPGAAATAPPQAAGAPSATNPGP